MIARLVHSLLQENTPWDSYVELLASLPDNY